MKLTLAHQLSKKAEDLQRSDIITYIEKEQIDTICFQYFDLEGDVRELMIPVNSVDYAHRILASGERVDGSSIFNEIVAGKRSDLYVVPIYSTAYLHPFVENTLSIICGFLNDNEKPAHFTPDNLLRTAAAQIMDEFELDLWALGELEFYIMGPHEESAFTLGNQKGYHQTTPELKYRHVAYEIAQTISHITGNVKYTHSEVGYFSQDNLLNSGETGHAEQYEVEFLPAPISIAARNMSIAKWVVKNIADDYGLEIRFDPKPVEGQAGNGLHFHLELLHQNNNIMRDDSYDLSSKAKAMIMGLCHYTPTLTALGNRSPESYKRLVPNQETPTSVYWNELDRNALVRIPLAWKHGENLAAVFNNNQESYQSPFQRQTVELRIADGSAHHFFLLAGICLAVIDGLKNEEKYAKIAKDYMKPREDTPYILPKNCEESAELFGKHRDLYSTIFTEEILNYIQNYLTTTK